MAEVRKPRNPETPRIGDEWARNPAAVYDCGEFGGGAVTTSVHCRPGPVG
jgi:hypothetical protein